MNTNVLRIGILVATLTLIPGVQPVAAQTVTLTPEQQAELERRKDAERRRIEEEHRLAVAQRQAAELEVQRQKQALEIAAKEATASRGSANFAMVDAMSTATMAGWQKGAAVAERSARAARVEMVREALTSWTPPSGYRYRRSAEVPLSNPFGESAPEAAADTTTSPASEAALESAVAGTCLEIDPATQLVRVGRSCGADGFDGRLAAGLYPVLPDGNLVDSPARARQFLALAAAGAQELWAFSLETKQLVRARLKGGRS